MDLQRLFTARRPFALDSIEVPKNLAVLMLAPHPDDFDAIGVTMRHFKERGNPIHVAVLTSGASGVPVGYGGMTDALSRARLREQEQTASCAFFGLSEAALTFLQLTEDADGHPVEDVGNLTRLQAVYDAIAPDLVFLPHYSDTNRGHRRTYTFFRRLAESARKPVAAFLNRDPKTIRMRTDCYMSFGERRAAWKGRLLRLHTSQQHRNLDTRGHGFDDRILQINRQAAHDARLSAPYAEVFEIEFHGAVGHRALPPSA
ncbi:MAG: PIG-L family deacetylase [Kiritimatiellae bacterium]|nr:PIG-L family deacetylase [Kiritimatiellia bacterium]